MTGDNLPAIPNMAFVEVHDLGVRFLRTPTFDEWKAYGLRLRSEDAHLRWKLGDWLNIGLAADWKIEAIQWVAEELGVENKTIANVAAIAASVPEHVRRSDLTFTHHAEVAYLEEADQVDLLERAHSERLTCPQVRAEARALAGPVERDADPEPEPTIATALILTATIRDVPQQTVAGWIDDAVDQLERWFQDRGVDVDVAGRVG